MGLVAKGLIPLKLLHNFTRMLPQESIEPGGRLLYQLWAMSLAIITKDFAMVYSSRLLLPLSLHSSLRIGVGLCFRHTLVGSMVCTRAASFWFGVSGSMEILGRMALAEVGFCGVLVQLGECILCRSSENKVVVRGWVQMEQRSIWVEWRWIWVEQRW